MKNSVCFIGHRKINDTPGIREKILHLLTELVENGYENFIFGDHSEFNDICHETVTNMKETHPEIKRINFRINYPDADDYTMGFLLYGYEESVFPKNAENSGRAIYVKRNMAMIDASEVCIFYYDKTYSPQHRKSGTEKAYVYAAHKNKRIINLI